MVAGSSSAPAASDGGAAAAVGVDMAPRPVTVVGVVGPSRSGRAGDPVGGEGAVGYVVVDHPPEEGPPHAAIAAGDLTVASLPVQFPEWIDGGGLRPLEGVVKRQLQGGVPGLRFRAGGLTAAAAAEAEQKQEEEPGRGSHGVAAAG